MAKPGPKPLPIAVLERTGGTHASTRRAEAERARAEAARAKVRARKRPTRRAIIKPETHAELLAGYDPHRDAGDCEFNATRAREAVRFFHEHLVHVKGEWAGRSFALEPWQQAIVMALYGWYRPDGLRRYREALIYVPRKNGKTFLASGFALHAFLRDEEPGAEVYCAAAEREQARILWLVGREQILTDPDLATQCKVGAHAVTKLDDPLATFKPFSAEAATKHGYNPHFAVVDELHVQKDDRLVEALRTGMGTRRQPMLVYITTARHWDPDHICDRMYEHACKVRDGTVDDQSFLPVIYEAAQDDDWQDEATWQKANPNYGISVKPEFLHSECAKALDRPADIDSFRRLYLNVRTNAVEAAFQLVEWDACREPFDPDALQGERCYGGLDLSKTIDLTAFSLWFPDSRHALVWAWIPSDTAKKAEDRDRVPYFAWAREGCIELTPGNVVDYQFVRDRIVQVCERFHPVDIAFDPWNGEQMAQELGERGLRMVKFIQGPKSYNEPCKELTRLVAGGELRHGGNPVLRWCASNLTWRRDANDNIAPDKQRSTGRIDAVTALCMAIGRSIVNDVEPLHVVRIRRL